MAAWGLGFRAVPVAAQSWMARAMPANVEEGLALFVSALQGSLAAGSLALPGRAGAAISAPSAGSADLARVRGREAPTPPPGTTDGAGKNAQRTR
ncbi:MAG TPA: hypothetical protein VGL33_26860 [Streptosporangiaceae bacterium]